MSNVFAQLKELQKRIDDRNDPETVSVSYLDRLAIMQTSDRFSLDFYGNSMDESYYDLLETIAQADIAPQIRSLMLRGADEGANGTHHWDITPLLQAQVIFSQLETFSIQLNQPGDHNRSIVGKDYSENGDLANLLARSPNLQELTVPSAPSAAFFEVGKHPLRYLNIDAGYDTQNFIFNFAHSNCFTELRCLEWGEYNETYMNDYKTHCTHPEHYQELFRSSAFSPVKNFVWRNPICPDNEIRELKQLRPNLSMLVIRYSANWG